MVLYTGCTYFSYFISIMVVCVYLKNRLYDYQRLKINFTRNHYETWNTKDVLKIKNSKKKKMVEHVFTTQSFR